MNFSKSKVFKKVMSRVLTIAIMFSLLSMGLMNVNAATDFVNWTNNTILTPGLSPNYVVVDDDGYSYVSGRGNDQGVRKFKPDGTLDTSWASNGVALSNVYIFAIAFHSDGSILSGGTSGETGLCKLNKKTGAKTVVVPNIAVQGVIVDSANNVYVNQGTVLQKFDSNFNLIWSKTITVSFGLAIGKDGSIYTSNEHSGTVFKYTKDGIADTNFGTNGLLKISNQAIGFPTYDDALYIGCYSEQKVKRVSDDGKIVKDVMSGQMAVSFTAKKGFYFSPMWTMQKLMYFDRPNIDVVAQNFKITATPTVVDENSKTPVILAINSDCTDNYTVTAKLINKITGLVDTTVTCSTATLANGDATLTVTPGAIGWQKGAYTIRLEFSQTVNSIVISDSLDVNVSMNVGVCGISYNTPTNGTINAGKPEYVEKNKTATFGVTPAAGYILDTTNTTATNCTISFNGNNATISNATGDVSVNVAFSYSSDVGSKNKASK